MTERYAVVIEGPWPSQPTPPPDDERAGERALVEGHLRTAEKVRSIWRIPSAR